MAKRRVGIMLELMWPYRRHLDVFAGTQRFVRGAGDWVCEIDEIFPHDERAKHGQLQRYDGIIARATSELAKRARRAKTPLVNVWFNSPVREQLPGVFPEFSAVGRQACDHLAERGFRQFGCLSIPREQSHQQMIAAFHAGVEELGHRCHCAQTARFFYRTSKSWARFQQTLDDWIATWRPPIALFVAFNDVSTRYVVHACQRRGLRVPDDVAMITATNEPMIGELPPPSLSSVEVHYEQIGYQAAEMLSELMRGKTLPQQHAYYSPTGVIARDSTDFFAVDDEVVALAMRFIERHCSEDIDVENVAAAAGVSRRTLERRFRASSGRSIAKEIRRLRLLKAKRLLSDTDLQVKQIAHETGFRDPIRLYEVFVREEKMTPSAYRQSTRREG